jgi:P27 family predicted phage terminase small subunit
VKGRKPKPVGLKLLAGNPGRRPLPKQPSFGAKPPSCPAHLDATAKAEWRRIVGMLATAGVLALTDRAALAAYCQLYSRVVKLEKVVQKDGEVLSETIEKRHYAKGGEEVVQKRTKYYRSPYAIELHSAYDQMKAFIVEFGLTPSSRQRLSVDPPAPEVDPLEELLKRGSQRQA